MPEQSPTDAQPPNALVEHKRGLSIVWFIPLVAVAAGAWIAYKAWSEQGPVVTITFPSAAGLQAGKTVVKFKDVHVGTVKSIELEDDLSDVEVSVQLDRNMEEFRTDKTRFWVESARITASRVSGLQTLFSGAFIGIDPSSDGVFTERFVGLDSPPVVQSTEPGKHFVLRSPGRGSINIGSPVSYRQINVGQVIDYALAEDGASVDITIFVREPHDRKVSTSTRFWNASGVSFSLTADGVKIKTESLVSVLIGGITFETPQNLLSNELAEDGDVFQLYASHDAVEDASFVESQTYLAYFKGTVRGLTIGSPVEFRGIRIGEVTDFRLEYDVETFEFRIPVLLAIEQGRVNIINKMHLSDVEVRSDMGHLVDLGLRAQLQSGNLLTGQLFINLDLFPDAPQATLGRENGYEVLPTVPSTTEEIISRLQSFLMRIESLPIEGIGQNLLEMSEGANKLISDPRMRADLEEAVGGANRLINDPNLLESLSALRDLLTELETFTITLNTEIAADIDSTLNDARTTLNNASNLLDKDSTLQKDIRRALRELSETARSIRSLVEYLERHPESLLRGK